MKAILRKVVVLEANADWNRRDRRIGESFLFKKRVTTVYLFGAPIYIKQEFSDVPNY